MMDMEDALELEEIKKDGGKMLMFVNQDYLMAFINEFQPEQDERLKTTRAISMGELRERLNIYKEFGSKIPDALPRYLDELREHGFLVRMGFSGEPVLLVSRRNNGRNSLNININ